MGNQGSSKNISQEERVEILRTLKEVDGDHQKAGRKLGYPTAVIRWVDSVENRKITTEDSDLGRPELFGYIVAVKYPILGTKLFDPWDNNNPSIKEARCLYDLGKVEMMSARTARTMILYAVPRKVRIIRPPYFVLLKEDNY